MVTLAFFGAFTMLLFGNCMTSIYRCTFIYIDYSFCGRADYLGCALECPTSLQSVQYYILT